MPKTIIMVVEDDRIIAEDITSSLEELGYGVSCCVSTGDEAVEMAGRERPDLVLMDIMLKGEMDGIEAAGIIRDRYEIPVVYLTAYADEKMLQRAKVTEPFGYLLKPFENHLLHSTIEMALYKHDSERELKEARKQFKLLAENIDEIFYICSPDYKTVYYVSPAYEKIWGMKAAGLYKRPDIWLESVNQEDLPAVETAMGELALKKDVNLEYRIVRSDGSLRWVRDHAFPVLSDTGDVYRVVGVAEDITERRTLMDQKARLYSMVTHDLKTPITAIMGYVDLLLMEKKDVLDNDALSIISSIRKGCKKMISLADDFLTISRMESGELAVNPGPVELPAMLKELADEFGSTARKKGLTFSFEIEGGLQTAIIDRPQVERAVSNLLQNAVNYTPDRGEVKLSAAPGPDGESIVISVADTGPGIPSAEQLKVFEQHYRAKKTAGNVRGSGLGLAIVKAVALAHGGRVELKSVEGSGSTFRLILPKFPPEDKARS